MKSSWIAPSQTAVQEDAVRSIHPLIDRILRKRSVCDPELQEKFLCHDFPAGLYDPFLFDDMQRCLERIERALQNNEKITVYGDYDVDGVCATSILFESLTALGGIVDITINHRDRDGYGLQKKMLQRCYESGTTLIITNDSGISNFDEIAYMQNNGVDVIITDHHQPPSPEKIPPAFAIIHPLVRADKYPFKGLCGAGVAFKLIQGMLRTESLRKRMQSRGYSCESFEKWLLDLVCIATIADCMPIIDENRTLVHFGLIVLRKTRRLGLRALYECARIGNKPITTRTIGFQIAPRINAAGRMEHANLAFELLTTQNANRASELASILEQTNQRRQKLTEEIYRKAHEALHQQFIEGKKILVGIGADWSSGILGLVASKLMQTFNRTVVLVTHSQAGRIGAARSIETMHITNIFRKLEYLFDRYGGHAAAGGFALKPSIDEHSLPNHFHSISEHELVPIEAEKPRLIDCEIQLSDVSFEFIELLLKLEPHGIGNSKPLFLLRNVAIDDIAFVGVNGKHVRMVFSDGFLKRRAIGFSLSKNITALALSVGDMLDIVTELDMHEWQDIREPQLSLVDFDRAATIEAL